jgi:tetratricopeptide (TPR) repeat protein
MVNFRKHSGIFKGIALLLVLGGGFSAQAATPIRQLLAENFLDEGVAMCRQFEVLSTNDNDNFLACAWIYYRTNRSDSAEKLLERIKRSFSLPEYQILLAYGKMVKKRFDEAKKLLDGISGEYKGTAIGITAQETSAEYYEMIGNLSTAAFIYKSVVDDDPKRGRSHWGLGRFYLSQGDTRRAIQHLEMTTTLWPKHLGSRFNLAVIYLTQDNLPEAAKWLAECYKIDKSDPGVLEQLGVLFEKKGLISDAVRHWQRALEIKKDSPVAKEKMAKYSYAVTDSLIQKGDYGRALGELNSQKKVGSDPRLLLRRGLVYRQMGKYEKSLVDLRAYLKANPSDPLAHRELGICYLNLKLFTQARNAFNQAASEEPDNAFNHAWLAYVLEGQGALSEARNEWQRAIDLFKDPGELVKATRKLASLEKKLRRKEKQEAKRKKGMDMGVGGGIEGEDEEQ